MLVHFLSFRGENMRTLAILILVLLATTFVMAQQDQPQDTTTKQAASKKNKQEPAQANTAAPDKTTEGKPDEPPKSDGEATDKEEHFDVSEVPPAITHHQITLSGKTLSYTANAGHMVYIDRAEHDKMKKDLVEFMEKCLK